MKILVAEDNSVTATLMKGVLTRHGDTVVMARNGNEALDLLESDPGIQGVITDIMMPESSGLDLLRAMQRHDSWRMLPTIVTTVRDDCETVTEAVRLGCRGYILKPIRPGRLVESVVRAFGEDKAVLASPSEVISRYSLDPKVYKKIAFEFSLQVDEAIALLKSWSSSAPAVGREEFSPIVESATLLGADRLLSVLDEVSPVVRCLQLTPQQCVSILEELLKVRQVLTEQCTALQ